MRIFRTGLLSIALLGAAITPGWCPEPADLSYQGRGGAAAVAGGWANPFYTRTHQPPGATYRRQMQPEASKKFPTGDARVKVVPSPITPVQVKPSMIPQKVWDRTHAQPRPPALQQLGNGSAELSSATL